MTCLIDALPGRFQQFVGDVARIAAAARFVFFSDFADKSECIGHLFLEDRVQQFNYEGRRCFIVVVKDDFAVADIDLTITH